MDVARFFVYGAARRRLRRLALHADRRAGRAPGRPGIRLVIDEFRTDVTKTRKDGAAASCGSTTATRNEPDEAVKWLWNSSTAPRPPASSTAARWS